MKTQTYQHNSHEKDKTLKKRRWRNPCDMREQPYRTWLQQTKQKYIRKRRHELRAGHPKLPCKILVHAYSRAFSKTTASRARLFLPSASRSRVDIRGYSRLRRIQKTKSRATKAPIVRKGSGKYPEPDAVRVYGFSVDARMRPNGIYVPKHFLTFLVKDAGDTRASTFRPRCAVEEKENDAFQDGRGTSYRTRFPRRRMQNS